VQAAGVVNFSRHNDAFTHLRMVRIMDQNVERLFLGSMSWDRRGQVSLGWLALWGTKPAGKASR